MDNKKDITKEDIKYPICPLNLYFEGDEEKCDQSKCDFNIETRRCTEACEIREKKNWKGIWPVGILCTVCGKQLTYSVSKGWHCIHCGWGTQNK